MKIQDYTDISVRCNGQTHSAEVPYYIFTDALDDGLSAKGLAIELVEFIGNHGICCDDGIELTQQSMNIVENIYSMRN